MYSVSNSSCDIWPDTKIRGAAQQGLCHHSLLAVTSASMPTRGGTILIPKDRDSCSDFPSHNSSGRRNLNSRFLILRNRATSNADAEQLLAKVAR